MDSYQFDRDASRQFLTPSDFGPAGPNSPQPQSPFLIAGIDEAGRGPLAGPVVAAAVILKESPLIYGLRDSKAVPLEQREALYCEIMEEAAAVSVGIIEPAVIDEINIFQATMKAMRDAVVGLSERPNLLLVDGNQPPRSGLPEQAVVKGDSKSASIMAASLIAKVTRDLIMADLDRAFPGYGFKDHKGYGCASHMEAIKTLGPCPAHRKSFEPVKSLLLQTPSLF